MFLDDTVNTTITVVLGLGNFIIALAAYFGLKANAAGRTGPGSFIGVKTARTKKSAKVWQYAHQAGMIYWKSLPFLAVIFGVGTLLVWQVADALIAQTVGFLGAVSITFVLLMGAVFATAASKDHK